MIPALHSGQKQRHRLFAGLTVVGYLIATVAYVSSFAFGREAIAPPQVTATSVYVVNADTGQPLYRKNENETFWILSITKLVTGYVAVERMSGQLSDTVTITQGDLTSGARAGLRKGDVWTLQDLL
jgi:D-alanyl-D-alanine carboxypeptidase